MRLIRSLFVLFISTIALSAATAQVDRDLTPSPVISRVCLWNADRTTWKALGLKRAQIERMSELRELYPAVVDGQWVSQEEPGEASGVADDHISADPTLTTSLNGIAKGTAIAGGENAAHSSDALRPTDLQSQLRLVLTPEQFRRWAEECGY